MKFENITMKIEDITMNCEDITMKFEYITSLKKIIGNPCKTNGYLTVHILYQRQNYEFTMYTQYLLAYFHLSI